MNDYLLFSGNEQRAELKKNLMNNLSSSMKE